MPSRSTERLVSGGWWESIRQCSPGCHRREWAPLSSRGDFEANGRARCAHRAAALGPVSEYQSMDDATSILRPTELQAQANLLSVLQLVGAGRLRCSETTRRPAAATVAAVAEVLDGGDFYPGEPIAAFAWPLLLQAGGLAELAGGRLQLTDRGRAALVKPAAATIRQLWRSWVTT